MITTRFLLSILISLQVFSSAAPIARNLLDGIGQAAQDAIRRGEYQREQLRDRRRNLENDAAIWRQALDQNPNNIHAQQAYLRAENELADIRQDERRDQERINKIEDMGMGLMQDATQAFVLEPVRAKQKREEAMAVAAITQRKANEGALDRIRHATSGETVQRLAIATCATGAALIAVYFMAKFGLYYAQRFVGMPKLVRESSDKNLWQLFVSMFASAKEAENFLNDVVLSPDIMAIINDLAKAAQETKNDGIPFRNVVLYGEPGTGKTMIAKRIARYCGMDYAILSGADFSQFEEGQDIQQLHQLFDRAETSKKGLLLFIDEAEAALRDRKDQDNRGKALVDAFLARTGEKSNKFMIVLATNHPQDLDPAVLSRISKKVHVPLPDIAERVKIMQLYLNKYYVEHATVLDGEQAMLAPQLDETALTTIATDLAGWSGRDLEDLIGELRYVLSSKHSRIVTQDIVKIAATEKTKQRKELTSYDGHSAAQQSLRSVAK
jgi:archaellum biogenesis ATPase FlaH